MVWSPCGPPIRVADGAVTRQSMNSSCTSHRCRGQDVVISFASTPEPVTL